MLKSMRKSNNRYFYHTFVSPGDAPGEITLNVVRMEREFDAYKLSRTMYPSIFNSFPVIRIASAKNRHFHVPQPTFFVSPRDALATITQYVASMERQFNACQTRRSMYLSIFNSFRVIRRLSQCVSPKSLFLPHFCFPWGRPWGNHAKCCMGGKRIRCLQIVCCICPSNYITVSETERDICEKIVILSYPLHSTPPLGGFP